MRLNTIVVAVAAMLLSPASALAGEQHSVKVRHADLDLASADGQRALDRRVRTAARQACGIEESRELAIIMRQQRCLRTALAAAKPAVALAVTRTRSQQVAAAGEQ